jgi:hypothetical protein
MRQRLLTWFVLPLLLLVIAIGYPFVLPCIGGRDVTNSTKDRRPSHALWIAGPSCS